MRGGCFRLQPGAEAALPPLSLLTRECRCRALRSACKRPGEVATSPATIHTDYRKPVPVRRAYVFRAYPTRPQEGRAVKLMHDHCDLYNAALEERREAWRMRKAPVSYGMQSAQLNDIRKADPGRQGVHSFTAQQQPSADSTMRSPRSSGVPRTRRGTGARSLAIPGSSRTPGSGRSGSSTAMGPSGSRQTAAAGRAPHCRLSARSRSASTARHEVRSRRSSSSRNTAAGTSS